MRRRYLLQRAIAIFETYTLLLPGICGFVVLFLLPFCLSLFFSFFQGVGSTEFVGFKNYYDVIESGSFRLAVRNTIKFIFVGIPVLLIISMSMACLAD